MGTKLSLYKMNSPPPPPTYLRASSWPGEELGLRGNRGGRQGTEGCFVQAGFQPELGRTEQTVWAPEHTETSGGERGHTAVRGLGSGEIEIINH